MTINKIYDPGNVITISPDAKEFVVTNNYGTFTEPNTGNLFPIIEQCCEYDYCEKCEDYTAVFSPVNMYLISSAAKSIGDYARDDLKYLTDRLPPIAKNMGEDFNKNLLERFDRIVNMIKKGEKPIPECTADEIALHLSVECARGIFSDLGEDIYETDKSITDMLPQSEYDGEFGYVLEMLAEDSDVLFLYDMSFDGIEDIESLGIVNLKPSTWFDKF